jgi:glutamate racemase
MELFARGAQLIVVACNTSSSVALRKIQQEYQQKQHPEKRVLGIVIPTAEEVSALSRTKAIGILATEATVSSRAYPQEIQKIDRSVVVYQQACPLLVPIIESGALEDAREPARHYVEHLLAQSPEIDTILLGCTHYALIEDVLRPIIPGRIRVVSQGAIVADKLQSYLRRHPETECSLDTNGTESFLSTEVSPRIQKLAARFFGKPIRIEPAVISRP